MNELSLRQALRGLRDDRQPSYDLWPGIAARLQRPAPPRRQRSWMLALAACALLATPALLLWRGPLALPAPAHAADSLLRDADAMALEYRAALTELGAAPLPRPLRKAADDLDRDAERLHRALERHPQARVLLHQLRRTYDSRLRLSQRAALG